MKAQMAAVMAIHPSKCFCMLLVLLLAATASSFLLASAAVAREFRVGGGTRAWETPGVDEAETYNHWASKNRFQIGDSLRFEYEDDDSVLVVDQAHYKSCNASDPLGRFDDGDTTFRFDRHGMFYFISGRRGHCESGQRLMVRVMADRDDAAGAQSEQQNSRADAASAPSPSGEPNSNAAFQISGPLIVSATIASVLASLLFA